MDGRRSLYLIALLVAALLFGPAVVSRRAATGSLRAMPAQERVVDALASTPAAPQTR